MGVCGAPFGTGINPQNKTWSLNLDSFKYKELFPGGQLPQGVKRTCGDIKDTSMYMFGGWTWMCDIATNVGGQTWPNLIYKLTFNSDK